MNAVTNYSPATGKVTWKGHYADAETVDGAFQEARTALGSWSALSLDARFTIIETYQKLLTAEKESLAEIISSETGKALWEAKTEVDAMIGKVRISREAYSVRCAERTLAIANGLSVTRHKPHGVIAVLGPFNFPGHLPNGHIVPALLAGNTVIFKPSEFTPATADKMAELWHKAGLPSGVFHVIHGAGAVGRQIASHRELNGLFFTGSAKTGQALFTQFSQHPEKILALEMGGNNPLIVADIADVDAAAYVIAQSAFLTTGQRCTCARRLIMVRSAHSEQILQALIALTQKLRIGPYTDVPEPFMGPLINSHAVNHLLTVQEVLKNKGGALRLEAEPLAKLGPAFVSPGIIDVTAVKERGDEEIFGPLLQVVEVDSLQEALREANATDYGLAAGLLSDHPEDYAYFYREARAGVINWNTPLTGASSAMPFGGIGKSGNFRPSAFYAADYCAYPVASMEQARVQWPQKMSPGIPTDNK